MTFCNYLASYAAIPYLTNPTVDPQFRIYFSKEWFDALHLSVRNFLSQMFNGSHILCYLSGFPLMLVVLLIMWLLT